LNENTSNFYPRKPSGISTRKPRQIKLNKEKKKKSKKMENQIGKEVIISLDPWYNSPFQSIQIRRKK
jgi:hypothetical protein